MGAMKKFLLLALVAFLSANLVKAEVTPDEFNEPSYIMNSGFSEVTASDILIQQSRANGVPAVNIEDKSYYHNPFIKAVRNTFIYLDPSLEDDYRIHHNTKLTPSVHDL